MKMKMNLYKATVAVEEYTTVLVVYRAIEEEKYDVLKSIVDGKFMYDEDDYEVLSLKHVADNETFIACEQLSED